MEYLTFCPKYVALKQPGIFLKRVMDYCRLWTFHFFVMFLLIPSYWVGQAELGGPRNSQFSPLPLSSLLLFSQEPGRSLGRQPGFLHCELKCWWFSGLALYLAGTRGTLADELNSRVWCWSEEREDVGRREWDKVRVESLLHSAGCWHAMIPAVGNWDLCGYQQCRDRNVSLIILTRERERAPNIRELRVGARGHGGRYRALDTEHFTTEADIKLPLSDASNSHLQFTTSIANTRWLSSVSVTSCYKLHS